MPSQRAGTPGVLKPRKSLHPRLPKDPTGRRGAGEERKTSAERSCPHRAQHQARSANSPRGTGAVELETENTELGRQ